MRVSVPTYIDIRYALGEVVTREWQTTGEIADRVAKLVPGVRKADLRSGNRQVLRQLKRGTNLYECTGTVAGNGYTWRKLS